MCIQRINAQSASDKLYVVVPCLLPHSALCGHRKWRHEGGDPDNSIRCVALVRAEAKSSCWLYLSPTRAPVSSLRLLGFYVSETRWS